MKVATLDFETDPFKYGREVCPFACGLFDGKTYWQTWGDTCVADMINILKMIETPLTIYAHNGGKFDFCFMENYIDNPMLFIQTRLVKAKLLHHEIRDSYAILPVPLRALEKDSIDYSIMEYGVRDEPNNKATISKYLEMDCKYLHKHVSNFLGEFGTKLTIGSASMGTLKKFHKFKTATKHQDEIVRPFYFGGRVQCFERGAIYDNLNCYDINSSYPYAMASCEHPVSAQFCETKNPPDNAFYFAKIIAYSNGALPVRTKNGLSFPVIENGEFMACSHEIRAAQELGLLKIKKIINAYVTLQTESFAAFVEHCMLNKIAAEKNGDKAMRLFWKLIANSAYGKFGQNPDNYTEAALFDDLNTIANANENVEESEKWIPKLDFGTRILAERPAQRAFRLNVAIAASITSAARAHLLRAIASAKRPIYCDTDSLICASANVELHNTKLGAWKNEAKMDSIFIAGRKTYAGFLNNECVKHACKGAVMSGEQIRDVVQSNRSFTYYRDAPSMRMFHPQRFLTRSIRPT